MQTISVTRLTPVELQNIIEVTIKKAFANNKKSQKIDPLERLTRHQICELYKISRKNQFLFQVEKFNIRELIVSIIPAGITYFTFFSIDMDLIINHVSKPHSAY